ncbi:hypothetical protein Q8791_02960 [Nocardiopsis sp. CT-R113]|uniref:Secreted protein n=1 Tax=Nocardiopsis codii TaxID=3065942 RepID=A0ABU7K1Q6_9ACTN|nr:hypothetical protein [Nocardiopsis sp. CT-R113]MEE2036180.1 hypothetical protein [Nocardiopsis sp. CT-R113]
MTQATRVSARTVLLVAGTAGFVALGAGIAGAEGLDSPVHELAPTVERALVEGVAPTVSSLAPEGVGPIANTALTELQDSAHNPDKPAPDLGAMIPQGRDVATPLGTVPNPTPALADTVSGVQDATGLDGNPHDTVGHTAGAAVEEGAQEAGVLLEDTARGAGSKAESTAVEVLPRTVEAVYGLREEVDLPRVGDVAPLPQSAALPDTSGLTALTGVNGLDQIVDTSDPLGQGTVRQSAAAPAIPNVWDFAHVFGLETPDGLQDVVEATPVTDDNFVSLGEEEVLGMVGNRNLDHPLTVPQAAPAAPGLRDLADAVFTGATTEGMTALDVSGPLADAELPRLPGTGLAPVDETLPQTAGTGLPTIAEGVETESVEDLVAGLSRGTDLLNDLDTSNLVSIEGGTEEQEVPSNMTQHPTFTDLPGSEALPVIS